MKTFKELFEFLQTYTEPTIYNWLEQKWNGKDKQESLVRLFAKLGLLQKLQDYDICVGNFNCNTIKKANSLHEIFFNAKNEPIHLNDKGDSSDLTGIHKTNSKRLLVCSSKCLSRLSLKKLDMDYILTNFKPYSDQGYEMNMCIAVKDSPKLYSVIKKSEKTSVRLKEVIEKYNTIVIDWKDLEEAYHHFKKIYGTIQFVQVLSFKKAPLVLRLHQKLTCLKTLRMKNCANKILWGHIQRSGKSYIIGGTILDDSQEKTNANYLIITTSPNETFLQYSNVFEYEQFKDFNVVFLNGKCKKPIFKNKNIVICSKQFLQTKLDNEEEKTRSIPWMKSMKFEMRFLDESHNGGTTKLAKKTLDYYGKDAFTVYITATYSKPTFDYQIPRNQWILWDLEDIHLCKNIDKEKNVNRLVEKHGNEMSQIISQFSIENIIQDFSKYPELEILTCKIQPEIEKEIIQQTENNFYGWSSDACFLLKQGVDTNNKIIYKTEFQNETENLNLWYLIFGKQNTFCPDISDDIVFMKRIEKICKNPMTSSRFVKDMDSHVIMAFLPPHNIDMISQATKVLLEKHHVIPDYDIVCLNSKMTNDPKQTILDAKTRAKNLGKKGVLVLSGKQCSLGVTIDDCDIVLLLNHSKSYDTIFQMMFRCMTEGHGKKRGFVIDLNIHRVIETTFLDYGSLVRPDLSPKDAVKYLLQERLIHLNSDHWQPCFGHSASQLTKFTESIYEVYSSKLSGTLENLFKRMSFKHEFFSKNEYSILKSLFHNLRFTKENIKHVLNVVNTDIKKGIEKTIVETDTEHTKVKEDITIIDPMELLRPISIVISLLTIHDKDKTTLEEMFSYIESCPERKTVLLNQIRVWWGDQVAEAHVSELLTIFQNYLRKDKDTTTLIRHVKELFCKNIKNSSELSKIIDKYLIPQENEKKTHAEVSTPFQLRQDMLNTIPRDFWTTPRKVFEPCSGKGGFLIDILERFMMGLSDIIPNEKERYQTIVEQCLYFADINPMNIFICRLLLDPYNEYKLNYYEGNTLELDVKDTFNIERFDAVIGNPPYNSSNGNKGKGNTLWNKFVEKSIQCWLVHDAYLLFIHPRGWRQINNFTGNMMKTRQILYLNMNDVKKGFDTFRCSTDYDYYLLQNRLPYKDTLICDYKNIQYNFFIDVKVQFIPNHSIPEVMSLIDQKNHCNLIFSKSLYETRRKWMSSSKTDKNKYPCIYTINSNNTVSCKWSNKNDLGHFGISKFIFSNGNGCITDLEGIYGLTEWAYALPCNKDNYMLIEKSFQSNNLKKIMDAIAITSNKYNYNVLKLFKHEFWKEFLNE
jgi:hypothetical protein